MSKSRTFSIYLLKEGFDATNTLKDDHNLDNQVLAGNLPLGSTLFVLDNPPRQPWWKEYFAVQKNLNQVSKGALIFLPVDGRCFALSFGHVYHNLKDESYEYDFGLRVTLNSVDPDELKSTDVLEPGAARRRRTQVPVASSLTLLDFDKNSDILKRLTGKVKSEHQTLFKNATGASNLRVSSSLAPTELAALCRKLLELYRSEDYKETFPDIQNICPVNDPQIQDQLNTLLMQALQAQNSDNLYLTIPDIVSSTDSVYASFTGEGSSLIYEDLYLDRYYEYLTSNNINLSDLGIEKLRKHRLLLTDQNGQKRDNYPLFKCLIFDTSIDDTGETYYLNDGDWFKVDNDYVSRLKTYLDPLCVDLDLPDYNHNGEGAYNETVAQNDMAFISLDKKNISLSGQTQVEPCDLYSVQNEHAILYHVKISTLSAQLSHLFNQGYSAMTLLRSEQESINKLKALIDTLGNNRNPEVFKAPIDEKKFRVVYAIITHKDKVVKSDNLPLFSRISLMRIMKDFEMMGIEATYGFVSDSRPKKDGQKKRRKQSTEGITT